MQEDATNRETGQGAAVSSARQFLIFSLGGERYAMPTERIREIMSFASLTEVPMMPDFLLGVINVRGAVVPVIDLSLRLGMEAMEFGRRTCVVILEPGHDERPLHIGVLVDVVHAVLDADPGGIEPSPSDGGRIRPQFIGPSLRLDGQAVISLDMARVLAVGELIELAGAAGQAHAPRLPARPEADA